MAAQPKHRPDEWFGNHTRVITTARGTRDTSTTVRAQAQTLTRHTSTHLQRVARDTENELALRHDWVEQRRADLAQEIDATFAEIGRLINAKDRLEAELKAKDLPLEINAECQQYREQRYGIDLVDDEVDAELDAEAALLQEVQELLSRAIEDSKEHLRLLRAANYQMEQDLQDKSAASDIDRGCRDLDRTSRDVQLAPESMRLDDRALPPEEWDAYTQTNIDEARKQCDESAILRNDIDQLIQTATDRLTQQANKVEDAFNVRIGQLSDAKREAETNLSNTRVEVQSQERTVQELEEAIEDKVPLLKLAQTRLTRRAARPNVEQVTDPAQLSLIREANEIERAMNDLREQLKQAESTLRALNRAVLDMEEDIACKTHSLNLDNKCMQRRQQYKYRLV
eukprot:m.360529 g.360529  ORF g.360529 m.360529 type:complete len:398 (-) comp19082_c0_seq1:401-1594(-)